MNRHTFNNFFERKQHSRTAIVDVNSAQNMVKVKVKVNVDLYSAFS